MIEVVRPGLLTSVQDQGRTGHRALGVIQSGAADPVAMAVANLLVGNRPEDAGLEICAQGPLLQFRCATWIALCGAGFEMDLDGRTLSPWRGHKVEAGQMLRIGGSAEGLRAWLAVRGGIAVAPLLGSRATDLGGGFGGHHGRALRAGDRLPLGPAPVRWRSHWVRPPSWRPQVRALPGPDEAEFDAAQRERFWQGEWEVGGDSNRMGCRLHGPALEAVPDRPRPSEAVLPGAVQVPGSGLPIALLADAQTTGGYPQIAQILRADLWLLALAPPGRTIRFVRVGRDEALAASRLQRRWLQRIEAGIACLQP